jgi:hypothetical protein
MRAIAFLVVLSMLLLSTVALTEETATETTRTDASRLTRASVPVSKAPKTEVPGLMNYQGTLTDAGGVALDTTVSMTFSIYTDSTGGAQVWTETQAAVVVSSGVFNVLLGRVNSISDTVFKDPERWLGVQAGADPELQPRQRIAAVGYALQSSTDGDWTISGSNMYSAVPGNVGIGTTAPSFRLDARDSHAFIQAKATSGYAGVIIDKYNASQNGYIIYRSGGGERWVTGLMNDDNYRIRYWPTATDAIYIKSTGDVGIGTTSPAEKLDVAGNTRITGDVIVSGPEKIKQPTQIVTYRFSPGGWSIRTDVGDVFQEPVGFTTSLMMKGGGAGNQNIAVMPLCLPRTGTIKEMRIRCRMTGPSGAGTAFQVVLLHQDFSASVGSPSGDPTFFVNYAGSSTANLTLTETQDHAIQPDHTYLLFAQVYGSHVNYVEIGMVELDIETTEYSPSTRW